jgi:hypothetical protein
MPAVRIALALALLVFMTSCTRQVRDDPPATRAMHMTTHVARPAPEQTPPTKLPPKLLEGHRVAGTRSIVPDVDTKVEIMNAGLDKVIGSFKICVGVTGIVNSVSLLRTTGFAAYDEKILREMRAWGYSPYRVNGVAVPVCTGVTFIYRQTAAPPVLGQRRPQ